QLKGVVTFYLDDGGTSLPRGKLWASWKPGESKTVQEERIPKFGRLSQVTLDFVGHVRRGGRPSVARGDHDEVTCQAQWDAATGRRVLFLPPSEALYYTSGLRPGLRVRLDKLGDGYELTVIPEGRGATHRILALRHEFLRLE